jgi:hypothetical protein
VKLFPQAGHFVFFDTCTAVGGCLSELYVAIPTAPTVMLSTPKPSGLRSFLQYKSALRSSGDVRIGGQGRLWRRADGTAGLPPAPEIFLRSCTYTLCQ